MLINSALLHSPNPTLIASRPPKGPVTLGSLGSPTKTPNQFHAHLRPKSTPPSVAAQKVRRASKYIIFGTSPGNTTDIFSVTAALVHRDLLKKSLLFILDSAI